MAYIRSLLRNLRDDKVTAEALEGSVSGSDLLETRVILGGSPGLTRVTVVQLVPLFSASETKSFSYTACFWGE